MSGTEIPLPSHPLELVTADDFEWSAELGRVFGGADPWVLFVRYRRRSTRRSNSQRWTRLTMVPVNGATFQEAAAQVEVAIVEHFRRQAGI